MYNSMEVKKDGYLAFSRSASKSFQEVWIMPYESDS
jgi:hypothetical protein